MLLYSQMHQWGLKQMAGAESATVPENVVLRQAMNSVDIGIAYFDADDRLEFWNDAYVDLNQTIAPMSQKSAVFRDLLAELLVRGQIADVGDDVSVWVEKRIKARNSGVEAERTLSDGRCFHVRELKVQQGGILGFWTDITEQKKASRISFDSPMGGLVNDFNNQLQVISGNVELALERTSDEATAGFLQQALTACTRLGARTRDVVAEMRR